MARRPSARTLARLGSRADPDEVFFSEHRDRLFRIREPAASFGRIGWTEFEMEFRSLGEHARSRRRLIVHNFGKINPLAGAVGLRIMRIPFLLFADETVEDRDDVIGPIFHQIMREAGEREGLKR